MTEKRNDLKSQLAANANAVQEQKPLTPSQQVGAYIKGMMPTMQQVLPKHVTAERMTRISINVIRTNPKLLECDLNSLMGGVMEAAKLGLEPGMMGQCYLLPFKNFKNNNKMEAQFIIGYKGLIDLVRRSGHVSTIEARVVYENDEFEYEYGLENKLYHKPTLNDEGAPIAYYAVCKMKDGGSSFLVMGQSKMEKYRDQFAKAKYQGKVVGPWKDHFEEMAKKTVLRQLIKYLPVSIENLSNIDGDSGLATHQEVAAADIINDEDFIPVMEGELVDVE